MGYKEYAIREFRISGYISEPPPKAEDGLISKLKSDEWIGEKPSEENEGDDLALEIANTLAENVLELLEVLEVQGHSGMSIGYVLTLFKRVALFKPLSPLTGEESEWKECGDGTFQNKRCGEVFKGKDGRAFNIHAVTWRDENGALFTNRDSQRYIEFPYVVPDEYPIEDVR